MKRIPVTIPLEHNGSICDVINDFTNKLSLVTGGDVDLHCDLEGNITIYYEVYPNKNQPDDFDRLLGTNVKSRPMSESTTIEFRKDGETTSDLFI